VNQRFWPVAEPSQADYESLREAVLAGRPLDNLAAARFARRGLAGLIAWPRSEPIYSAVLFGADRPPWTPYVDPRVDTLASSYELILDALSDGSAGVAARSIR
jgi:hypothetical protein